MMGDYKHRAGMRLELPQYLINWLNANRGSKSQQRFIKDVLDQTRNSTLDTEQGVQHGKNAKR